MNEKIKNDAANAIRAWGKASPSKEDAIDLLATLYNAIGAASIIGESDQFTKTVRKIGSSDVTVMVNKTINDHVHDQLCDLTCWLEDQPSPKVMSEEEIEFEQAEDRKALMQGERFNEGLYGM